MKIVKTTDITTAVGMPVKSGTIDHIQSAYKEVIDALCKNLRFRQDTTAPVRLWGLEKTLTIVTGGVAFAITQGALYYNGEVFLVDAQSGVYSTGQTIIANVVTTFFSGTNADPVTFTDSVARNVHEIRKITFTDGVSGSGLFDFNEIIIDEWQINQQTGLTIVNAPAGVTITDTALKMYYKIERDYVLIDFVFTFQASAAWSTRTTAFVFDLPVPSNYENNTFVIEGASTNGIVLDSVGVGKWSLITFTRGYGTGNAFNSEGNIQLFDGGHNGTNFLYIQGRYKTVAAINQPATI
jgi:hypothetical protein